MGARPPTWAPDYDSAGVAITIHKKLMPHLRVVQEVIERQMKAVFYAKGGDLTFICAYALTANSLPDKKDQFYEDISDLLSGISGAYYIRGNMNARLYNRKEEDEQAIGPYCLWRAEGYIKAVDTHGKTISVIMTR